METTIRLNRPEQVDDGFGGQMAGAVDRWVFVRAKLSRRSAGPMPLGSVPTGLDTDFSMFILTDYQSEIREGDAFPGYRVGPVDKIMRFGKIIGYQAPLTPA